MNIRIFPDHASLYDTAADEVIRLINSRPDARIGLATGSTPLELYKRLVAACRAGKVSFRNVTTFNLDEYAGLPKEHPQSYHSYMQQHLFRHVDLPGSQTHLPDGEATDPEAECRRYDRLLEEYGPPDLQILGIGHNGHIGFNEPGESLLASTHVVTLSEQTRQANARFFPSADDVPDRAITMGIGSILKAGKLMLIATGEDKAGILQRALEGPLTTHCPASFVQTHANVLVLADAKAGKYLTGTPPFAAF